VLQAQDVAAELGATLHDDGQTMTRHGINFRLSWHRPRGYGRAEGQPDRIHVQGHWPKTRGGGTRDDGDNATVAIEVSSAKSARQIARDIDRRLLKPFAPRHAAAVAVILDEHQREDERKRTVQDLVGAIPGATIRSAYRDTTVICEHLTFDVHSPTEVYCGGFTCTPAQAAAIAAVLKS
jgi:hypothetical protein